VEGALATVRRLVAVDWELVKGAGEVGLGELGESALRCHPEGAAGPSPEGSAVATAVEASLPQLVTSLDQLRKAAAEQLQAREDAWRPHGTAVAEWLPKARTARKQAESLPNLKAAEKWVKDAADTIRNERFAPIADHTRRIWEQLRLQSNVSLEDVHLGGTGKARKVELKVTVDDPVQSMDPARVDGLARVLQSASKDRQVVVFTHDDRLPEALRRLDIDAKVIEVTRGGGSIVGTRPALDPIRRYIEDAIALANTEDLPEEVARRVIPGLCREAIEAACMAIRRRRIGKGEPHAEVETLLSGLRAHLICLSRYLDARDVARKTSHAWAALTRACHHHPYDLPAVHVELKSWLTAVAEVLAVLPQGEER
jgi:hypothetical protein